MGEGARAESVLRVLGALEEALGRSGAVDAAESVLSSVAA